MVELCLGVSGVMGRSKGCLTGDSGWASRRREEDGVGNGMGVPLTGLRAVASKRSRASADVGAEPVAVGNRGSAEYGIFGLGDGVGEDARDVCRCLTRCLVCNCGRIGQ
jgi:hypothetical protein